MTLIRYHPNSDNTNPLTARVAECISAWHITEPFALLSHHPGCKGSFIYIQESNNNSNISKAKAKIASKLHLSVMFRNEIFHGHFLREVGPTFACQANFLLHIEIETRPVPFEVVVPLPRGDLKLFFNRAERLFSSRHAGCAARICQSWRGIEPGLGRLVSPDRPR